MKFDNKQYYVILDLEGTMEITEMSSVIYDKDMKKISSIQCFVQNHFIDHRTFLNYVYRKYGRYKMAEEFLSKMKPLQETMYNYDKWLKKHVKLDETIFITCGNWDLRKHIPSQFKKFNINVPNYFKTYINIKDTFQRVEGIESKGMDFMLDFYKIRSLGKHHCAIYDVHNIGQILRYMLLKIDEKYYNHYFKINFL